MKKNILKYTILPLGIVFSVLFFQVGDLKASVIDDLKQQIAEREQELRDLEQKNTEYKEQLGTTKQEKNTLNYEISRINSEISSLNVTVKKTQTNIIKTNLLIEELRTQIEFKEEEMEKTKERLGHIIRIINAQSNNNLLSVVLSVRSFSELFNQQEYLINIQKEIQGNLSVLKLFRDELKQYKRSQEGEKENLKELSGELEYQRQIVNGRKNDKTVLLRETQNKEKTYQQLIAGIESQLKDIETEINVLEAKLRLAIDKSKLPVGKGILRWPLDSYRITQGYGKPNWRAAYDFHNGIDLAAPTGTPVKAALGGKVVGVGNNGRYSYGKWISINHGDLNITTMYGHLSLQRVKIGQEVDMGEVIGYVGSTGYSTGAHLHFTVFASESYTLLKSSRVKNLFIPVGGTINPMDYL